MLQCVHMLSVTSARGAIFDIDETLLDTGGNRYGNPSNALHERARLQAFQEVGKRHTIPDFITLSAEDNLRGFLDEPVHSLEAAVWHIMFTKGIVATEEIEPDNLLLREIVARKDELFEDILRADGKPFPGAVSFVAWLAENGLQDHLAIASTAIRRDIEIFLDTARLGGYFSSKRIIAKEDVTHAKPNPEAFNKAFAALSLPEPARPSVLAFEDNPRGIMSAKAAGLFTCAISTVLTKEDLLALAVPPDLVADSFDEFRELLS